MVIVQGSTWHPPHLHSFVHSLSPNLCEQPMNQLKARLFHRYFPEKFVNKIVANGFWSFYHLCWFWKNIFQVEFLDHLSHANGSGSTSGSLFLVSPLNLGKSPSVWLPSAQRSGLGSSQSVSLSLALGGSPAKVCPITFRTGYLKFCFSYTGYSGYLSLLRLCQHFFCSLPLYSIFSSWAKICTY
jgi:hypothetical protein